MPLRVAHVITRLIIGGAQENTAYSVLGLKEKPDLRLRLISGPTSGPEGSIEALFDPFPGLLSIVPELVRPIRPWQDVRALRKLTSLLRQEQPHIVHTHSGKAGILGRLAASKAGVPIIIHTIHGPSFGGFQGPVANAVFRAAEKRAARVTTHFVVVADAMRDQYLAAGIGTPNQYTRILSGFKLEPFLQATNDHKLRSQLGIGREDIVVGKIARLTALKGHEDLLSAAPDIVRACPRVKFLLIGDGGLRAGIEARARELGVGSNFAFAGLIRPDEVARYVGIMDLLVHLSLREGLPRALPQALAAGKPVVAYNCDGAREVCLEGRTGFLVDPHDVQTLSTRVVTLLNNAGLRQTLGAAGRALVQDEFSIEKMVDGLHDLYLRLAAEAGLTSAIANVPLPRSSSDAPPGQAITAEHGGRR